MAKKWQQDLELTLSGTSAEPLTNSSLSADSLTVINSAANTNNIKVGDTSPSITLEPGDTFTFYSVVVANIYAQGQSGDRVEAFIEKND